MLQVLDLSQLVSLAVVGQRGHFDNRCRALSLVFCLSRGWTQSLCIVVVALIQPSRAFVMFCLLRFVAPLALGGWVFLVPRLVSVSPRRCLGCCRPPLPWSCRLVGWPSAAVLALLAARPGCVGPWLG